VQKCVIAISNKKDRVFESNTEVVVGLCEIYARFATVQCPRAKNKQLLCATTSLRRWINIC